MSELFETGNHTGIILPQDIDRRLGLLRDYTDIVTPSELAGHALTGAADWADAYMVRRAGVSGKLFSGSLATIIGSVEAAEVHREGYTDGTFTKATRGQGDIPYPGFDFDKIEDRDEARKNFFQFEFFSKCALEASGGDEHFKTYVDDTLVYLKAKGHFYAYIRELVDQDVSSSVLPVSSIARTVTNSDNPEQTAAEQATYAWNKIFYGPNANATDYTRFTGLLGASAAMQRQRARMNQYLLGRGVSENQLDDVHAHSMGLMYLKRSQISGAKTPVMVDALAAIYTMDMPTIAARIDSFILDNPKIATDATAELRGLSENDIADLLEMHRLEKQNKSVDLSKLSQDQLDALDLLSQCHQDEFGMRPAIVKMLGSTLLLVETSTKQVLEVIVSEPFAGQPMGDNDSRMRHLLPKLNEQGKLELIRDNRLGPMPSTLVLAILKGRVAIGRTLEDDEIQTVRRYLPNRLK